MIIAKAKNVGIDAAILIAQRQLDTLKYQGLKIYGRVYRNHLKGEDYVAEVFSQNLEYREIFVDDSEAGIFGFHILDDEIELGVGRANVLVIFTGNLLKLDPARSDRYDEELKIETVKLLDEIGLQPSVVRNGVDEVFDEFEKERLRFRDMQPFIVFAIETQIQYTIDNLC